MSKLVSERFRHATPDDAARIAHLHADSWRRHYRGAYSDEFLDGDVVANRLSVWDSRLAAPENCATIVAENGTGLAGFVHVVFDEDARWAASSTTCTSPPATTAPGSVQRC